MPARAGASPRSSGRLRRHRAILATIGTYGVKHLRPPGTREIGIATFDINTCVISGNLAAFGGGIYNDGPFGVTRTLTNTVLDRNFANNSGGIFNRDTSLEISNSTLSNNESDADPFGGAIQNQLLEAA
jgi:hypothetical protein